MLGRQVLADALRRQTEVELGLDDGAPRLAVTGPPGGLMFLGRRRCLDAADGAVGADGRYGWF
jgi:hypothetical protein